MLLIASYNHWNVIKFRQSAINVGLRLDYITLKATLQSKTIRLHVADASSGMIVEQQL